MCPDNNPPVKITEDDGNNYKTTDNVKDDGGPSDEDEPDETVPVFGDVPTVIPPADDGDTPYTVTIETPDNSDDIPMTVDVPITENVKKIVVYIDDVPLIEVSLH